jgi:hypothetical protein
MGRGLARMNADYTESNCFARIKRAAPARPAMATMVETRCIASLR